MVLLFCVVISSDLSNLYHNWYVEWAQRKGWGADPALQRPGSGRGRWTHRKTWSGADPLRTEPQGRKLSNEWKLRAGCVGRCLGDDFKVWVMLLKGSPAHPSSPVTDPFPLTSFYKNFIIIYL